MSESNLSVPSISSLGRPDITLTNRVILAITKETMDTANRICDVGLLSYNINKDGIETETNRKLLNRLRTGALKKTKQTSRKILRVIIPDDDTSDQKKERSLESATVLNGVESPAADFNIEATLKMLQDKGYTRLASRLQCLTGYPKDDILRSPTIPLIEQLFELYETLHSDRCSLEKSNKDQLFECSLALAKQQHPEAETLLGRLLYLIDSQDSALSNAVWAEETLIQTIEQRFDTHMKEAAKKLDVSKALHTGAKFQSYGLAARTELSLELSHILLSNNDRFNFGIVPVLLDAYVPQWAISNKQKRTVSMVLKQLALTPSLREKLLEITKPTDENAPANTVVRAAMDIPSIAPITDLDAKRTALSALLSTLRQGKEGSCFATPLAIALQTTHLDRCLADFQSLLSSSKLTRSVNHSICDFPFMLPSSNKYLKQTIGILQTGELANNTSTAIWEVPGIRRACHAIGISSPQQVLQEILPSLELNHRGEIEISTEELVKSLVCYANTIEHNQDIGLGTLYLRATFALDAQENHPLLQVWGNGIAGMAEPDETGMVKSAIVKAVMGATRESLKKALSDSPDLLKITKKIIRNELLKRTHLLYDPIVEGAGEGEDLQSTEGAFVLYDKSHYDLSDSWIRIDTPLAFSGFISRMLETVSKDFKQSEFKDEKLIVQALDKLASHAITPEFTTRCLHLYYERNNEILDPLIHYQNIKYAPWITKCGNNFSKVIQVYLEKFQASNFITLKPRNAKNLLIETINLSKGIVQKDSSSESQENLIPIRIPEVHAFNLMLSHPSLQQACSIKDEQLEEWIDETVLQPGKRLAESVPEDSFRNTFITEVIRSLIPRSKIKHFKRACDQIPQQISLENLRLEILKKIIRLNPAMDIPVSEIALQVDTTLISCLPKKMVDQLIDSSVHIADSNWSEDIHDIHFCILTNPGNGKMELWGCEDERGKLTPYKQETWFHRKEWEVFVEVV